VIERRWQGPIPSSRTGRCYYHFHVCSSWPRAEPGRDTLSPFRARADGSPAGDRAGQGWTSILVFSGRRPPESSARPEAFSAGRARCARGPAPADRPGPGRIDSEGTAGNEASRIEGAAGSSTESGSGTGFQPVSVRHPTNPVLEPQNQRGDRPAVATLTI